jgi:sec-independent protein translocase protein TatC
VVTQVMMALPLMVMYELSIIGARVFGRKKPVPKTEEDKAEQGAS